MRLLATCAFAFAMFSTNGGAAELEKVPESDLVTILSTLTTVYSGRLGIGGIVQVNIFKADDSLTPSKECGPDRGLNTCPRARVYVAIGGELGVPTQLWRTDRRIGWVFGSPQMVNSNEGVAIPGKVCDTGIKPNPPWPERAFELRVDASDYLAISVSIVPMHIVSGDCQIY